MKRTICLVVCALMIGSLWGCKDKKEPSSQDDLQNGIISGISLGMTEDEVIAVMGEDYTLDAYAAYGSSYQYVISDCGKWHLNMPAVLGFDFNADGKLYQYYYDFGLDGDGKSLYTDADPLLKAYTVLKTQAEQAFGEGTDTPFMDGQTMQEAAGEGCFGWLSWDTPQGELNVFGGMDMWREGNHMVGISCVCDPEIEWEAENGAQ